MKKSVLTSLFTMMSASAAFAADVIVPPTDVPEAGATGSLAALAAVAAVGAITWERRRRSNKPD